MENKKLTLADVMLYPNAEIIQGGFIHYGIIHLYDEVIKECNDLGYGKPLEEIHHNLEECQLILRSIDELTEDEKKELIRLCSDDTEVLTIESLVSKYTVDFFIPSVDRFHVLAIDYLRSIGIDIDGFLENGKAVKK